MEIKKLENAPKNIEQYFEIATQYNDQLPDLWNNLKPEERIFAYCMYRASIPGNQIIAGQTHRDAVEITDLFEKIIKNKEKLPNFIPDGFDYKKFLSECEKII